jgi:hypothetical protein
MRRRAPRGKSLGKRRRGVSGTSSQTRLLIHQAERYPFIFPRTRDRKTERVRASPSWYLAELRARKNALLDMKENVIDLYPSS